MENSHIDVRNSSKESELLDKVKALREYYFPNKLLVGNCSNVAVLLGNILQSDGHIVKEVHGYVKRNKEVSGHVWLQVDGASIDPSLDCRFGGNPETVVSLLDKSDGVYTPIYLFDCEISRYFTDTNLEQLIELFIHYGKKRS